MCLPQFLFNVPRFQLIFYTEYIRGGVNTHVSHGLGIVRTTYFDGVLQFNQRFYCPLVREGEEGRVAVR